MSEPTGAPGEDSRSPVERFLGLFTEVKAGEATLVLALAFNVFLLLAAYYLVKPVREALILSLDGGAEIKSYAAAGQALLLLGVVPFYGWLAGQLNRKGLINGVTLFICACLVGFYLLIHAGVSVAVAFYLWVGIYNVMIPAQFWSFANDLYTPESGKRLFVIVAFGASIGAVAGGILAGRLIHLLGVEQLLLVAAGLLAASLLITNWADARSRRRDLPAPDRQGAPEPVPDEGLGKSDAFALVVRNRYLLLIGVMMFVFNWVNTNGEYILGRLVKEAAVEGLGGAGSIEQFIGGFYADYFTAVNIVGMLLQLFVVSRVLKYLGVGVAVCVLPVLALLGSLAMALVPVLGIVRVMKIAENSTDYSLQNTVRQVLFLPTTRAEKYKAKQAIDTFFVRCGDMLSAGLVFVGTALLALPTRDFAIVNVVLSAVWIGLAVMIGRRHRALVADR